MADTQELRRRWSTNTTATFSPSDRHSSPHTYTAESYEREFDFKGCRNIVFLHGRPTGLESDVLLMAQGTGHMTLPAGVQVLVESGYAKCCPAYGSSRAGSVIGTGVRAPPPSRAASSYAESSFSRAQSYASSASGSQVSTSTYRAAPVRSNSSGYGGSGVGMPSPPRDGSTFKQQRAASYAGSSARSYVSARGVPLPPSVAGRSSAEWDVVEEMDDGRSAFAPSISPSESISSVGSRRSGSSRSSYSFY